MTDLEKFEKEMRGRSFDELERYVNMLADTVDDFVNFHRSRAKIVLRIIDERIANESKNHNNR
jgi:hypothetical protein